MLEKMETDERCVEEKCKDAQNFSHQLTIASLLSSSLSSRARRRTWRPKQSYGRLVLSFPRALHRRFLLWRAWELIRSYEWPVREKIFYILSLRGAHGCLFSSFPLGAPLKERYGWFLSTATKWDYSLVAVELPFQQPQVMSFRKAAVKGSEEPPFSSLYLTAGPTL